ncbi:MAG: hypothetical protein ACYDBJ_14440, partial [Aggregatilineales bacterium]
LELFFGYTFRDSAHLWLLLLGALVNLDALSPFLKSLNHFITMLDPQGNYYYEQIGLMTSSGDPIAREIKALDDIELATGIRPIFTPYGIRR